MSVSRPDSLTPERMLRLIRKLRALLERGDTHEKPLTDVERGTIANGLNALVQRYINRVLIPRFIRNELFASDEVFDARNLRALMAEIDTLIVVGDDTGAALSPQEVGAAYVTRRAVGVRLELQPSGDLIREVHDQTPLAMAANERGSKVPPPPLRPDPKTSSPPAPPKVLVSSEAAGEPPPEPEAATSSIMQGDSFVYDPAFEGGAVKPVNGLADLAPHAGNGEHLDPSKPSA